LYSIALKTFYLRNLPVLKINKPIFYTSVSVIKNIENVDPNLVEEAHLLVHPIRFRMVELLAEKPMHINEIAKDIGVS